MEPTPEQLSAMMAKKSDAHLLEMLQKPADRTPEALHAAEDEIQKRNLSQAPEPVPSPVSEDAREAITPSQVWEVKFPDGSVRTYPEREELVQAIIRGEVKAEFMCRLAKVSGNDEPEVEPEWKIVRKVFNFFFKPLRARIWQGAGTGAMIGMFLFLGFKTIDFGVAALKYHLPKLIGISLVYVFFFAQLLNVSAMSLPKSFKDPLVRVTNLAPRAALFGGLLLTISVGAEVLAGAFAGFTGIWASFAVGAIFGGLSGMAVGACMGVVRRNTFPKVPDTQPENISQIIAAGFVLPLLALGTAVYSYVVYFLPWATEAAIESLK